MSISSLFRFLPALTAGLLLASTATGFCDRKVTVIRDRDGDGHYNKKTYDRGGSDRRYYSNRSNYYGRGSYGRGYYGRPGYYGSYSSYRPYYSDSYYYSRPSVTLNYSRSDYADRSSYSDDLAVEVQRELRRRGYYRGTLDGDIGPGTRSAIRNYQEDRGIAVTGRIDRSLLRALDIG